MQNDALRHHDLGEYLIELKKKIPKLWQIYYKIKYFNSRPMVNICQSALTPSSLNCHLYPQQAANCCRNSRLVADEDDFMWFKN